MKRNLRRDPTVGLPRVPPEETRIYPTDDEPTFEEEVIEYFGNFDEEYHSRDQMVHTTPEDVDDPDDPWSDLGRYRKDHPVES